MASPVSIDQSKRQFTSGGAKATVAVCRVIRLAPHRPLRYAAETTDACRPAEASSLKLVAQQQSWAAGRA